MRPATAAGLICRIHEVALREEALADAIGDRPARAYVAQQQGHHDIALLAHLVAEVVQHEARPRRLRLLGRTWR